MNCSRIIDKGGWKHFKSLPTPIADEEIVGGGEGFVILSILKWLRIHRSNSGKNTKGGCKKCDILRQI